ncbi:MAG: hypothetical protein CL925_10585 [Deltaproteobacteria bacterium]|nr:hypothetical protein [Deltaproteobacteria bacterium]
MGIATFPDYPKAFLDTQLKRIMGLPKFKDSSLWILTDKDLVRSKRIRLATDFSPSELCRLELPSHSVQIQPYRQNHPWGLHL